MQQQYTRSARQLIQAVAFGLTLLAASGSSLAGCGEAGGPCPVNQAPATQQAGNEPNVGVGNPINVITGNKYQQEVDLPALPGVLGLEIVRHYNSSLAGPGVMPGPVGRGWRLSYETELEVIGNSIEITQADGSKLAFGRDLVDPDSARHRDPARGIVTIKAGSRGREYLWTWNNGRKLSFDSLGKLVQIQAATGEILTLQRDARGLLTRVTDPQGRSMRLTWLERDSARAGDRFRGVQSIDTPAGRFSYTYGSKTPPGATVDPRILLSNLVAVSLPASEGSTRMRQYHYEDGLHPTFLTGISVAQRDNSAKTTSTRFATYAYRGDGKAVLSTHAGQTNKVTLDFGKPNQTTLTNSLGQTTVYRYASIGGEERLTEVRGMGCSTCAQPNLRYNYDARGRLIDTVQLDKAGLPLVAERNELDAAGRTRMVSRIAYVNGKAQSAQVLARYVYAAGNAPQAIARPSVVAGKEVLTQVDYNAVGQPVRVTVSGWSPQVEAGREAVPITRTTSYAYRIINGRSVLTEIDGPLENGPARSPADSDITTIEYDPTGSVVTRTLSPGMRATEVLTRDDALRPTLLRKNDGVRQVDVTTSYTPGGQISAISERASMTGPGANTVLAHTTRFGHDASGNQISVTGPDGVTMRTAYDDAGRPVALIDPKGNRIDSSFDSEGKLVAVVLQDQQGTMLNGMLKLWDEDNQLRAVFNPATIASARSSTASTVQVALDGNANATAAMTQAGQTDLAMPDQSTRQVAIRREGMVLADGARRLHATLVDDFGRVLMEVSPDEGRTYYHYRGNNVEKVQRALDGKRSVTETLRYDPAGLLRERSIGGCTEQLVYQGALLRALAGCGTSVTYQRDAFGAITQVTTSVLAVGAKAGAAPLQFTETFVYEPVSGRLAEHRLPDGQRLVYRYDSKDGKPSAVLRDSGWVAWVDNRLGQSVAGALRAILPDSATSEPVLSQIAWRPFEGMTGATAFNGVAQQAQFDQAGRVSAMRVGRTSGADDVESLRYEYDRAGQVAASSRNGRETRYRYDGLLRLTQEQQAARLIQASLPVSTAPTSATLAPVAYSVLGQRAAATPQLHDSFGRQSGYRALRYQYDDAHRLSTVTDASGAIVARYRYDVRGNRVAKTVAGQTTYYVYDNSHRLVAEADQDGKVIQQYLYSDYRPYAMMQRAGGGQARTLYAIHADQRGLPMAMTDAAQNVVWRGQFDAFGDRHGIAPESQDHLTLNLRLAGQYEDSETGLYYNVHRYYDPRQGRYITPDPIGLAGGEDAYAYVDSNPMGGVDPLGLFKIPPGAANGNDFYFKYMKTDPIDHGHGDILREAFFLYQKANPNRFSQAIIDQIIINNYHTDAENEEHGCLPVLDGVPGGGQCLYTNHFDNPNESAGAPYKVIEHIDPVTKKVTYTRSDEFRDTYKNTTWLKDGLDDVNEVRKRYDDFEDNGSAGADISQSLNAFGRNSHVLADFYAHSNWVDAGNRGGCWTKTNWASVSHGWVPNGLNQRVIWDEGQTPLSSIFTGTVAGTYDILWSGDMSTHGYWNKDEDKMKKDEVEYKQVETDSFNADKLFFWTIEKYDKKIHTDASYKTGEVNGWETTSGTTSGLVAGMPVMVARPITNRHRMATALAVQHTMKEIDKLWNDAAGKNLGITGKTLQQAFGMTQAQLHTSGIGYRTLWPKAGRP
ncbi:MAG TPA: RHS repeat-associated core domain-containing protein [Telluria sp.]|jgi:RHS repeat-associated protein